MDGDENWIVSDAEEEATSVGDKFWGEFSVWRRRLVGINKASGPDRAGESIFTKYKLGNWLIFFGYVLGLFGHRLDLHDGVSNEFCKLSSSQRIEHCSMSYKTGWFSGFSGPPIDKKVQRPVAEEN